MRPCTELVTLTVLNTVLPFGSNLNLFMQSVHRTLLNIFSLNPTSISKNYNISHKMAWVCANSISFHLNI